MLPARSCRVRGGCWSWWSEWDDGTEATRARAVRLKEDGGAAVQPWARWFYKSAAWQRCRGAYFKSQHGLFRQEARMDCATAV